MAWQEHPPLTPLLYPREWDISKQNTMLMYLAFPDGSVRQKVFLAVDSIRRREEIVAQHYLKYLVRTHLRAETGVDLVSRDQPWDFRFRLNRETELNIEITAIADNQLQFEVQKREEKLRSLSSKEKIRAYELKKLVHYFPESDAGRKGQEILSQKPPKNAFVANPYYDIQSLMVSMGHMPDLTVKQKIENAIKSKWRKNHYEKEETILILDNMSSHFDAPEISAALHELAVLAQDCPFREIYVYTGFYSDDGCNDCEFSLIALKQPEEMGTRTLELYEAGELDSLGRLMI